MGTTALVTSVDAGLTINPTPGRVMCLHVLTANDVYCDSWVEAVNPMQIMFSVLRGIRPDTSLDSLPGDIPSREILINLMTCGWTSNPDERPSFLSKCHFPTTVLFGTPCNPNFSAKLKSIDCNQSNLLIKSINSSFSCLELSFMSFFLLII